MSIILIALIVPLVLYVVYLIAKKYPKVSRELHKPNCDCGVCKN